MARKLVLGIFISFCFVLLMSHNTFAFDFTSNMKLKRTLTSNGLYWTDDVNTTWRNSGFLNYGRSQSRSSAVYFKLSDANRTLSANQGDIVVITGSFYATSATGGTSNTAGSIYVGSENLRCTIVDFEASDTYVDNISSSWELAYFQNFTVTCVVASNPTDYIAINLRLETNSGYAADYAGITFKNLFLFERDTPIYDVLNWLRNNSDDAGDTLKQEKQDVQDAADDSETIGESSSQDAEAGTASLISAIGSAVSVISSASPTNCRINGDMGKLDVGQIDLCANPVPAFVQVIGSLILILITVPLCITLFNRFIGLFRSFQG